MKTKSIILIACVSIATLSFVTVKSANTAKGSATVKSAQHQEPIGGLVSADRL